MLELLPYNILDDIIGFTSQNDLVSLARTDRMFRYKINKQLYKQIIIIDSEMVHPHYTIVPVEKLSMFLSSLNEYNFQFVQKLLIHSQSNLIDYDYTPLYRKLLGLWKYVDRSIFFVNFDIQNLRNYQSFNQYIMTNSITYTEGEDNFESVSRNTKVNNLTNWVLFNYNEFEDLPFNKNLTELDMYIEPSTTLTEPMNLNPNVVANFQNLSGLYLNTTLATSKLVDFFEDRLVLTNLKKLSITNSHTYKEKSLLDFNSMGNIINFNNLEEFELKICCSHHDCNCIYDFFNNWFNGNDEEIHLKKFILINYKSKSSKQNFNQFQRVLTSSIINSRLQKVEYFYLNLIDFMKIDNCQFNIKLLLSSLQNLHNLTTLVIPDFFYNWVYTLPSAVNMEGKAIFDLLLNQCCCNECVETRQNVRTLSNSTQIISHEDIMNLDYKIEYNKSNMNFFNQIISSLKKQFVYINQNLFTMNSILNSNDKPFVENKGLISFNRLFLHGCLSKLIRCMKQNNPNLNSINIGGILVKFDHFNNIKFPYN